MNFDAVLKVQVQDPQGGACCLGEGARAVVAAWCGCCSWFSGCRAEELEGTVKHLNVLLAMVMFGSYCVEWRHFVNLLSNL